MKEFTLFPVQTVICLGAFLLLYRLVILRRAPYNSSRLYLLVTPLLALATPLLNIPVYPGRVVHLPVQADFALPAQSGEAALTAVQAGIDWTSICAAIYVIVAVAMVLYMAIGAAKLAKLKGEATRLTDYGTPPVYASPKVRSPFSTGRSIFIPTGLSDCDARQIIAHESSHIRHGHFYEKTFLSILRILMWYNPFLWITTRWLGELHEYEADKDVLEAGYDLDTYRMLILKQVLGHNPDIVCGLNNSLTKKRFIMMTNRPTKRNGVLRSALAISMVGGLMMLFSFTRQPDRYETGPTESLQNHDQKSSYPLILLDGTEISASEYNRLLDEGKIRLVKKLTDSESLKPYGAKGANGVMIAERVRPGSTGNRPAPDPDEDTPLLSTEVMPSFQGGDLNNFRRWFMSNMKYPEEALKKKIQGKVILQFIVERDGSLGDITIVRSPHQIITDEVISTAQKSPNWTPGTQDGKPVRIKFSVPIEFVL